MNAKAITHEEAISNMTAERYLLGELTEAEHTAYEEHLFSCNTCFEQIKLGSEFVDQLRNIPSDTVALPGFMTKLAAPFSHPAMALVLGLLVAVSGVAIHQSSVISHLKEPKPELRYTLVGIAHGADGGFNQVKVAKGSGLSLNVEYARNSEFTSYHVQVLSDAGKVLHSITLPESQRGNMASVDMPAESLKPGKYSMVVFGRRSDGTEEEVGHSLFELQPVENQTR
jgi:hypothetical protein